MSDADNHPMPSADTASAREREIFLTALELPEGAVRDAFLSKACDADENLKKAVHRLLEFHQEDDFLETSVMDTGVIQEIVGRSAVGADISVGQVIGRYRLLERIGEGGCGSVFLAEQEEPIRRRVALKVIKLGMDTTSVVSRFEAERQTLAIMDHPNIAQVYDAGATELGRPFFVMELVPGEKITQFSNRNRLTIEVRLRLFLQVCQAIQHAHQKGVIHRDIKPSNILVMWKDSIPHLKVIDFGIAKAMNPELKEETFLTEAHAFFGTPAYMSPEQAMMGRVDIDTRSDIYSLGVLLYELLTDRVPFENRRLMEGGVDACRRTILEVEPEPPSKRWMEFSDAERKDLVEARGTSEEDFMESLKGDLDWIVMKCLEKERGERYASTAELILEVQSFLDGDPVKARPPSSYYRMRKLYRRHRPWVLAGAMVVGSLVVGLGVCAWLMVLAMRAEQRASESREQEVYLRTQAEKVLERVEREKNNALVNEYIADINLAQKSLQAGNFGRAVQLLDKHQPALGKTDLRGWEWNYLKYLSLGYPHSRLVQIQEAVTGVAVTRERNLVAVGGNREVVVWDLKQGRYQATIPVRAKVMGFFAQGSRLMSADEEGVWIWETEGWELVKRLEDSVSSVKVSPKGNYLAMAVRNGVRMVRTDTWEEVGEWDGGFGPLTFSSNEDLLAFHSRGGISFVEIRGGQKVLDLEASRGLNHFSFRWANVMGFSPDDSVFYAVRNQGEDSESFTIQSWDVSTGRSLSRIPESPMEGKHSGAITSMVLLDGGRTLATGSWDHSIGIWDLESGKLIRMLQGHLNEIWALEQGLHSKELISGSKDGEVNIWTYDAQIEPPLMDREGMPLAISQESNWLALQNPQRDVEIIDLKTFETIQNWTVPKGNGWMFASSAISSDFEYLAMESEDNSIRIIHTPSGSTRIMPHGERHLDLIHLSNGGRFLIVRSRDSGYQFWDLEQNRLVEMASWKDRVLPSGSADQWYCIDENLNIEEWNSSTGNRRPIWSLQSNLGFDLAISRGETWFAATQDWDNFENSIRLWDFRTGRSVGLFQGHKQGVYFLAFSPDGRTLASSSDDGTIKLWNVATQQELLTFSNMGGVVQRLMFSPDGQWLIGARGSRGKPMRLIVFPTQWPEGWQG